MKLDRRAFVAIATVSSATSLALAHHGGALAQPSPNPSDLFDLLRPENDPEFGPAIRGTPNQGGSIVGTAPARHDEIRTAFRLLLQAPTEQDIISTARYFQKIATKNADGEPYNWEWSVRSNPLIVGLFAATGTAPASGDQTHWCAAFVSYCLFLANKPNKYTALSGGYRTFGSVANSPTPGDIAVFAKTGPDGAKGFGHVGFFLKLEDRAGREGLVLLGGNQRGGTGSSGAVTEAWYPVTSSDLELHSIRRIPGS